MGANPNPVTLDWPVFDVLAYGADPAGRRDSTAAIQAAIDAVPAAGGVVWFPPGKYKISALLTVDASNIALRGAGMHITVIFCTATTAIAGMLEIGSTQVVSNISVSGFQLNGNGDADSGHNVLWRAEQSNMRDMILQQAAGDCLHIDPATLGGSASQCVFENVQGIAPGGNGVYIDKLTDSDFFACTFNGGTSGDTVAGGSIGINLAAGSNLRFHGCHAYLFAGGGASVTGTDHAFIGGELESNGTADLIVTGASHCAFTGVAFYDYANAAPPAQHIHVTGDSTLIDIGQCMQGPDTYAVPAFAVIDAGSTASIHDCPGYNPVGLLPAQPAYASGVAAANDSGVRCRVFTAGTTAVALNGTPTGLAAGTFVLDPGETITPTGAGSWTWFGL